MLDGISVERWVDDVLRYEARASHAGIDRSSGVVDAKDVRIRSASATVTAARALGELSGDTVTLVGDVRIVDETGRVLSTERATYEAKAERVIAPDEVRLIGANFDAAGRSLEADLKTRRIRVQGPLKARFEPTARRVQSRR